MAANLTIYCLKEVTDYFEFERLCHDLMSLAGYDSIEPLGGSSDKGRDAIHINESNVTTIFAYSVREDWRAKLAEDAEKVYKHRHTCNEFVFITTAKVTASQRDEAVESIKKRFGWQLKLFDVERLRILLEANHPEIKEHHPSIFPPDFLAIQDQIDSTTKRNHLFISSVDEDGAFADWLTRKLTAEGYLVWCERSQLLGGETYPDDVDYAIKNQTFRFISLYSRASLKDPEIVRQRSLALNIAKERKQDFFIPLDVDGVGPAQLDHIARTLQFISFKDNWATGLRQLLKKLASIDCPRPLSNGKQIAAEVFLGSDVRSDKKETLFSNCLRVQQIPKVIYRFKAGREIPKERLDILKFEWSSRRVDPYTFLSFHKPPTSASKEYKLIEKGGALWVDPKVEKIHGIWIPNLVSELIRKALIVKCYQKGLQHCHETGLLYFPPGLVKNNRLNFIRPDDDSETYVFANGQRTHPSGEYLYSLAPNFFIRRDLFDDFTALVRIRIRFSDTAGKVLRGHRTIVSRRKHLCKGWWNKEWFNRTLAVSQFLEDEGKITIGESRDTQIIIDANPLHFDAPIGINEEVLGEIMHEQMESLRSFNEYLDEDIKDEEI